MTSDLSWVPPYTFRRSVRAKRLSLRVDARRGLEIVLPHRVSEEQGFEFMLSHRYWVEKHAPIGQRQALDAKPLPLINQIYFPVIDKSTSIAYIQINAARKVTMAERENGLCFYGRLDCFKPCVPLMRAWLLQQAKLYLPQLLAKIAQEHGFDFRKVGVRDQKTRWGSCNAQKDIQLNYRLILLPKVLAHYVMLHELCHTIHMNHSPCFWALVHKYLPGYKTCIRALKSADALLPEWL